MELLHPNKKIKRSVDSNQRANTINDCLKMLPVEISNIILNYDFTIEGKITITIETDSKIDFLNHLDNNTIISGSTDSRDKINVYNSFNGNKILTLYKDVDYFTTILETLNIDTIITIYLGYTKIWNSNTGTVITEILGTPRVITNYIFYSNLRNHGDIIFDPKTLFIFTYNNRNSPNINMLCMINNFNNYCILPNNKILLTSYESQYLQIYTHDTISVDEDAVKSYSFFDHEENINISSVAHSLDNIIFGGNIYKFGNAFTRGYIGIFDSNTMKITKEIMTGTNIIDMVLISSNKILCLTDNKRIEIWNLEMSSREQIVSDNFDSHYIKYIILPDESIAFLNNNRITFYDSITNIKHDINFDDRPLSLTLANDKQIACGFSNRIEFYQ